VVRASALRILPLFGPPAQKKDVSKLLIRRIGGHGSPPDPDPSVRIVAFNTVGLIQFENKADNDEAVRVLATYIDAPVGSSASVYRLAAIQAITLFGPSGERAITALTGQALRDPSYETRRNIAAALGQIGFDTTTGPNMKALTALADRLAKDECAAVRLEALQSILLIGPPWAATRKPDDKTPPPIEPKSAAVIVKYMRARVGDPNAKPKPIPPTEKDKQVEILARLVLMRFDPKEISDENIDALASFLTGNDVAAKIQAITAFAVVGEMAARKVNDVVRLMEDKESPLPLTVASIQALMAMGAGAKPALPNLQKMRDEKQKELKAKELELAKKKDDPKLTGEKVTLEELVKLLDAAIKHIGEAKPRSPSGSGDGTSAAPAKKP
jgi:HEAT repeat protein